MMTDEFDIRRHNVELGNNYLRYLLDDLNRSTDTVKKYRQTIKQLIDLCGPASVLSLTERQLRDFCHEPLRRGRNGKEVGSKPEPATVKRKMAEVKAFYAFCTLRNLLPYGNPTKSLVAPKVHNERPNPVQDPYWRQLWASDLSDADRVGFGFANFVGLRRNEVCNIDGWHVVNDSYRLGGGMLIGLVRKGGNSDKPVPWRSCLDLYAKRRPDLMEGGSERFLEPLRRLIEERGEETGLIPWQPTRAAPIPAQIPAPPGRYDPMSFNRRLKRACAAADIPEHAITPHRLRHSFVTNMLRMGVDLLTVSRLANHSSVSITQRYAFTEEDPLAALLAAEEVRDDTQDHLMLVSRW